MSCYGQCQGIACPSLYPVAWNRGTAKSTAEALSLVASRGLLEVGGLWWMCGNESALTWQGRNEVTGLLLA